MAITVPTEGSIIPAGSTIIVAGREVVTSGEITIDDIIWIESGEYNAFGKVIVAGEIVEILDRPIKD